jgi:hypothetical protein
MSDPPGREIRACKLANFLSSFTQTASTHRAWSGSILRQWDECAWRAEPSDSSLLKVGAERANHALTFHLPFVAAARREGEDGSTVIAVNCDTHVAIQTVRVPTLMVTMHAVRGYRVDGKAQARRDDRVRCAKCRENTAFDLANVISMRFEKWRCDCR